MLFLFAPFQTEFVSRIFGNDGGAAEDRISLMRLALQIIQDHPLFGVGANNFGVAAT